MEGVVDEEDERRGAVELLSLGLSKDALEGGASVGFDVLAKLLLGEKGFRGFFDFGTQLHG